MTQAYSTCFTQMHIDVAKNSTDDFNLFHDRENWRQIINNPFGGPIVLGFQLSCFIEHCFNQYRITHEENTLLDQHQLAVSNYQLSFANAVKPDDHIQLHIKPSKFKAQSKQLSNRLLVKSNNGLALMGFKTESQQPLFGEEIKPDYLSELDHLSDRSYTQDNCYFYKRKFTTNSNAKNFLAASGVKPSDYFDELNNKIEFPQNYCSGLISCALLESASIQNHDFKANPMVYVSHQLSIFSQRVKALRSDQILHLLVDKHISSEDNQNPVTRHCVVLNKHKQVLVQGSVVLAPLAMIMAKTA